MGDSRGAYRVLLGRYEGKKALGRPGHKWDDNIKIYLQEVGWGGVDWINLAQDKGRWGDIVNAVMNLRAAPSAGNFLAR
jgi:hypothetical protein